MSATVKRPSLTAFVLVGVLGLSGTGQVGVAQAQSATTFKSAVDVVSITAVVRDQKGRVVRNLSRDDFEVFDRGRRQTIVDFSAAESGPVSIALLFDVSGSMQVAEKLDDARQAAQQILSWLEPDKDETALYTFDSGLREVQGFTRNIDDVKRALKNLQPYGATSLYDAIAETAQKLAAAHGTRRSAVIVLTDGVDTGSRLTPSEVSGIASSIDVPVYMIAAVSPLDHPGADQSVVGETPLSESGGLSNLVRWTGGDLFVVSSPAHASAAARQMLSELRHQYLIAFASAGDSGWHPLEVRTRDMELRVRSRSGYMAGQRVSRKVIAAESWVRNSSSGTNSR